MIDGVQWLPALNFVLGVGIVLFLSWRLFSRQGELPEAVKLLMLLSIALLFGLLTVSASQIGEDVDHFDTVVITLVKVTVIVILWKTRHTLYRTGTRHVEGGKNNTNVNNEDSDDPNRDIEA